MVEDVTGSSCISTHAVNFCLLSVSFCESELKTGGVLQGCRVGGKISDSNSNLSKISGSRLRPCQNFLLRLVNIKGTKFDCDNRWKSCCTARYLCFNKSFKRNCTISTGIPNLGVWCKNEPLAYPESDKKSESDSQCCLESDTDSLWLRLRLRLRLRNPGVQEAVGCVLTHAEAWKLWLQRVWN